MAADYLGALKQGFIEAFESVFDHSIKVEQLTLSETKKEFEGDFTLVVFPFTRDLRQKPEAIATAVGTWMKEHKPDVITDFNVIKGFLNVTLPESFWTQVLTRIRSADEMGIAKTNGSKVLVEYSSPNTNKPLHLGHIRNILLGWSTAQILEAVGHEVLKTKIVNDRGIAICKSMLAWQLFGNGATPETTGKKGDYLVGEYYVAFDQKLQQEYKEWQASADGQSAFTGRKNKDQDEAAFFKGYKNQYFNEYSKLGRQVKEMLIAWEEGDKEVRDLWETMNNWVYAGFDETYDQLGVAFDFKDYESNTYLLGKDIIQSGLDKGTFYRQEDGSVWVDLEDRGLDKKILLRSDGTSVYITQDLGTARMRYEKTGAEKMIYVVGDEQDYHFQVLFEALKKLEEPYAEGLYHLSYGMVDLPTGKMKSREGTVVDADVLIQEVINEVKESALERGELVDLSEEQRQDIYRKIGLAALKFFILKVNPKKRMVFDPKESVDMQGQTGPYIQNAYVRIQSIQRKVAAEGLDNFNDYNQLDPTEKELIRTLMNYPDEVAKAADQYDPSVVANFVYDLAKKFHKFYHDVRVLSAETAAAKAFRLGLSDQVAETLAHGMALLGIEMPERM